MKLNNPSRILVSIIILVSGAVWIWISADPDGQPPTGIPIPKQGFPAPDFDTATMDGGTTQLSSFIGSPVIINFWASWCTPCRTEMPALENTYRDYQNQGLVILAINATSQDNLDRAKSFVDELGLTFPILLDPTGEVTSLYRISAFPTTFFIDSNGLIQDVVIGGPMAEALLRSRTEQLLGVK